MLLVDNPSSDVEIASYSFNREPVQLPVHLVKFPGEKTFAKLYNT